MAANSEDFIPKDLAAQIADAISRGIKAGSKQGFSGASFMQDMTDEMDNFIKAQKAREINERVYQMKAKQGLDLKEAEQRVMSQLAKEDIANNIKILQGKLKNKNLTTQERVELQDQLSHLRQMPAIIDSMTDARLKQLKVQREQEALDQKMENSIKAHEKLKETLKAQLGITEELVDQFRTPEMAKAIFAEQMAEKLGQATEQFEGFREMGLSAGDAMNAQFTSMDVTSMDWWLGLSDTKGVMQGIVEEYGNVNALSKETVGDLGKMATHLGISGQEVMKLNAGLSQLPGETSETAANAMEHTAHLAEAQGIAGSKVFADMSKNTGAMALYSKGGAEAFGKSAVALHKMGVEIGTAAKMADGLLNFEDSINKQMEASVLLGREINLDKARELALNGDLEGSTAEVLKNIGGSAEFEKMNVMQKKALAEATGMTVEELQKSIDAQEESNKYFGEGASVADKALGTLMEYGSSAAGFFKENGMLIMTGLQLLQTTNLTKVKGYAADAAHWVKEKAHMLWVKAQSMLGLGGGAAKAGATAAKAGAGVVADKGADMAAAATDKAAGAAEKASKVPPGKGGIASTLKDVAEGIKAFANKDVVLGAGGMVLAALGLAAFLPAIPSVLLLSIPGIGASFQLNAEGIAGGLKALGNPGVLKAAAIAALVIALFGASLIPLTYALSLLAPVVEAFGKVITAVFEGMAVLIGAIADAFVVMFQAFAENWQVLIPVGIGLGVLGAGMLALGAASWFAFPGLMLAAAGLGLMIPGLTIVNEIAQANAFGALGESLTLISAAAPGLLAVAGAMAGIGAGLGLIALAGLGAIPVFGAMMALAAVAPMLASLGSMFGGGGEEGGAKEDKMDKVVEKLDQLIAVASKGGEVKMDGKKVGEVVRLGLNMSNVR